MSCPKCGRRLYAVTAVSTPSSLDRNADSATPIVSGFTVFELPLLAGRSRSTPLTLKQFKSASPGAIATTAQDFALKHFDELCELNKTMGWELVTEKMKEKYKVPLFYQTLRKYHTAEKLRRNMDVSTGRSARR